MNLDFLWSKGVFNRTKYMLSDSTIKPSEEYIINLILGNSNVIWIRNNIKRHKDKDIYFLAKNINLLKKDIIIITGDSDLSIPSSYSTNIVLKILNNKFVKKWYTQNYDRSIIHEKFGYFPIGLDLHTKRWLINNDPFEKIRYMIKIRFMNMERINNKIFCDTHLRITHNERKNMYEAIRNNIRIDFQDELFGFNKITIKYRRYKLVVSPIGNGLDCHRTWELFLLGCIVITKSSSLDQMWIDNKLPVVIINDWQDLNFNLKTKIKLWINKYDKYTGFDYIYSKFKNSYWINFNDLNYISIENNINIDENLDIENNKIKEEKIKFINTNESISKIKNICENFDLKNEYIIIDSHINDNSINNYIDKIIIDKNKSNLQKVDKEKL